MELFSSGSVIWIGNAKLCPGSIAHRYGGREGAAASFYTSKHNECADRVVQCIKLRLSWSDLDLMRAIIFVLSTHGWEKALEEENDMQAVDHLVQRFATPLERSGV